MIRHAVVLVVLLAACERAEVPRQPPLWHAPKVGDRSTGMTEYSGTIHGPDGRAATLKNHSEYETEVLALDGDYPTKMKLTFVRDDRTVDGLAKPGLVGTYEVTEKADGSLDVVRLDGAASSEAVDMIKQSHHQSRKTVAAAKQLVQRGFKPGQTLELTQDEVLGLGFGMSSVRLVVREVNPKAVVFSMENTAPLAGGTLTASGALRWTEDDRELVQDGTVARDGTPLGTMHIVQKAHTPR